MDKKILLYIVFIIFSLILTALAYFGLIRLFQLKRRSCESCAESYIKLPRVDTKHKIIVSMFTEEQNLDNIKTGINSILDQTVRVDQIIINIPETNDFEMPAYIKDNNIIIVHKINPKYGKCSSFVSPLLRERNGEAIIILVGDKTVYGSDFVETLAEESEKHKDSVVYVSGYTAKGYLETGKKVDNKNNDVVDIDSGVLIKPSMFSDDILDIEKGPINIKNYPNVYLSYYINREKINKIQADYSEIFRKPNDNIHEKLCLYYYSAYFPSI